MSGARAAAGAPAGALRLWVVASRPRTLPAAVAPVLVGTALAISDDEFRPLAFVAALVGSVFLQIGTNLANDYSDARRGADTEDRLGPVRVTAGGLMPPRSVLVGTYVAFGVAVLAGVYLTAVAGWEMLLVGALSIVAGVLYTGGPRPYGYAGLGELFVFVFFGLVAVVFTYYAQAEEFTWEAFALAVPVGLLAAAILVVNNVRDLDTDRRAGKRTLAVKLGRPRARTLFGAMLALAFAAPVAIPLAGGLSWWVLLALLALPLAPPLYRTVATRTDGPALNGALAATGRLLAVFSLLLSAGRAAVVRRSLLRLSIPLREPFVTSGGVVSARELAVIRLEDDEGTVGFGEAAPLEPYDGVTVDEVIDALREGPPPRGAPPQARAAWELAELDLQARRRGRPLGEPGADAIPVNLTLPAGPPEEVAAAASAGHQGRLLVLQGEGRPARRPRPRGRGARGGGLVAGAAGRRQRRLEPGRGGAAPSPPWRSTTWSWWSSRAPRSRRWPRCAAQVEVPVAADESIVGVDDVHRPSSSGPATR